MMVRDITLIEALKFALSLVTDDAECSACCAASTEFDVDLFSTSDECLWPLKESMDRLEVGDAKRRAILECISRISIKRGVLR